MVFDLLKKKFGKKSQDVSSVVAERKFGPTLKKKITYELADLDKSMMPAGMFGLCDNTPLPVVKVNGQPYGDGGAFVKLKEFPNPVAEEVEVNFSELKKIFGEKIAKTVVEYYAFDSKSGDKPVITLFAMNLMAECDETNTLKSALKRLNHATRRDCLYNMKLREQLLNKYQAAQRNK